MPRSASRGWAATVLQPRAACQADAHGSRSGVSDGGGEGGIPGNARKIARVRRSARAHADAVIRSVGRHQQTVAREVRSPVDVAGRALNSKRYSLAAVIVVTAVSADAATNVQPSVLR